MTQQELSGLPPPGQTGGPWLPIRVIDDVAPPEGQPDPGALILTCANCGATMDERKCKLICRCGYFLSCSDYY